MGDAAIHTVVRDTKISKWDYVLLNNLSYEGEYTMNLQTRRISQPRFTAKLNRSCQAP